MEALTAKASLVDPAMLGDEAAATTAIPRSEIEEALRNPTDLFLDVERYRDGKHDADRRITVSWESEDLERLLETTTSDPVVLAFKAQELDRMFGEPDVEAQGLRERAAILTVAAATAAGVTAGVANAQFATGGGAGGSTTAAAQRVTDTSSSGPAPVEAATPTGGESFTDASSSGPAPVEPVAEATSAGGGESFFATSGGQAALAGGVALLIAAAGFAAMRQRTGAKPA